MFNIFKKKSIDDSNNLSLMAVACLLIHSAKIDQNFTDKERVIVKKALIEMGADSKEIENILIEAEIKEKDSNQLLDFTKYIKNINKEKKEIIIEAMWNIIYSDGNADMYESNLMRRLSGLLYLDNNIVGNIKEKIKLKEKK